MVKNLSRLLSSSNSKGRKGAYHYCINCLNGFRTESAKVKHYMYCSNYGEVKVKMPAEKDKWLKFHNGQCQFKDIFIHSELTDVLEREYEAVENCHICLKTFDDPENRKIRDHCHYTGLYRGTAHNNCNLKYRIPEFVPIAFHNLSGYDVHLFIKEFGRNFIKDDIGVIAENKEKYISFSVKIPVKLTGLTDKNGKQVVKNIQLRFIDSFRFMVSSLDKLARNLDDKSARIFDNLFKMKSFLILCGERVFILMSTWIAGRNLERQNSHLRRPSTAS